AIRTVPYKTPHASGAALFGMLGARRRPSGTEAGCGRRATHNAARTNVYGRGCCHMSSQSNQVAPHPASLDVDWGAVEREAVEALSAYVKIDSSHPAGCTTETARFIADRLAEAGIESKLYETPEAGKVNLLARLKAENTVG